MLVEMTEQPSSSLFKAKIRNQSRRAAAFHVQFSRRELTDILSIYGTGVINGHWRDYAIDHLGDRAIFSIFRRASEVPLYRVEKHPNLEKRQGLYSVITATGLILKRGHELKNVLKVFDKRKFRVVE